MDREAGNMLAGIGGNFRERIFFRRVKEDCYSTIQTRMETYFTGISYFENYYLLTFYQLSLQDINFGIKIIATIKQTRILYL